MLRLPNGKMTIARGPDGTPVGVLDVPRGQRCGCTCPECGQKVMARVGPFRAGHFSHVAGSSPCTGMRAWHGIVRDVICGLGYIDLGPAPPVPRLAGVQRVLRSRRECSILGGLFRPDATLETQAGITIAVEVVDTHDVPAFNVAAMLQEQWLVLRVDVRVLQSALAGKAIKGALADLLGHYGPWQSWPMLASGFVQQELVLEHGPWWARLLRCISSPPADLRVAANAPPI